MRWLVSPSRVRVTVAPRDLEKMVEKVEKVEAGLDPPRLQELASVYNFASRYLTGEGEAGATPHLG